MGKVISLREADNEPANVAQAIALAFRKAARQMSMKPSLIPGERACNLILNRIVDSATRGMRNIDQLCEDALAHLHASEEQPHEDAGKPKIRSNNSYKM